MKKYKEEEKMCREGTEAAGKHLGIAKYFEEKVQYCEESESLFFWKKEYRFNAEGLKTPALASAELKITGACGKYTRPSKKVEMSATPNFITFKRHTRSVGTLIFNINRRTLKAGRDTDRNYHWELKEVDTSDNLI